MECPKCRSNNKEGAKKCSMCGYDFTGDVSSNNVAKEDKPTTDEKHKKKRNVYSLLFKDQDIQGQVNGYTTLKLTKTFRWAAISVSALYFLFIFAYMYIFSVEDLQADTTVEASTGFILGFFAILYLIEALVVAVFLFFVYKGHRWPSWLFMTFFAYIVISSIILGAYDSLLWPIVLLILYFKNLLVENRRRKKL